MASQQRQELSHHGGQTATAHTQHQAGQEKSEGVMTQVTNAASGTAQQASQILQQTGESVKNMAVGAADAVKSTIWSSNTPGNTPSNTPSNPTNTSSTTAVPTATTTATATNTTTAHHRA